MSFERRDVHRLFRHFGLDPSQYLQFAKGATPASDVPAVAPSDPPAPREHGESALPRYLTRP
jgi:hypothetical protein